MSDVMMSDFLQSGETFLLGTLKSEIRDHQIRDSLLGTPKSEIRDQKIIDLDSAQILYDT